ncbi:MAG TPA: sulfotransferase [Candidatus Binatia bacterium]|jgi:hypothetical protein
MEEKVVFVVGSPRSGSTMLARMISSHSLVYGRPEPHLLTPLAHLGYYANVDKAPYDHVLAAESTREFVADLPGGEQDYIDACRAYADTLYLRMLATRPNKRLFLDKTPAYALVLEFIAKIYPNAKFVVLTRHPLAVFSSFAESFFDSDYQAAHAYNPITERYVPAIAKFLRAKKVPICHVVYEDLVSDPETIMRGVFEFLDVPFEASAINYGEHEHEGKGLGDPIGVAKHSRPSTASLHKWAGEIAGDPARLALCRGIAARLDPEDLATWGHPIETFWKPLEDLAGKGVAPKPKKLDRYRLERRAIVTLRAQVQKHEGLRRILKRARLAADVLLRE